MSVSADRRRRLPGYGWMLYASVLFFVAALSSLVWGLSALLNDDYFRADELLFGDLSLWGVVSLCAAAVQGTVAFLLLLRRRIGVTLGIVLAVVHATVTLFSVGAYPLWSVLLLVLDGLIIYGLTVHGDDGD